ncbi:MAG: DNA repair protein RecO [Holosporaceae bacterium]|jgi:DNA repair protein RecO (recombination protein O)|nr:DNA repair protein RecO [Holosporaceae bacterium]
MYTHLPQKVVLCRGIGCFTNGSGQKLQWQENSVILSSRPFGENFKIVTAFNRSHGKVSGLLKGTKIAPQAGDISDILWRGRSAEQLGIFKIENIFSPFACVFNDSIGIFALESVCFICSGGLPEKAPHPKLFDSLKTLLLSIPQQNWLVNYAIFEVNFLSEIGFGLSLSKCAVSGETEDLRYISPKTGCAVTGKVGEKYKDRLFSLPRFLISASESPTAEDVFASLKITGHFLDIYFHGINNRGLPPSRKYLAAETIKKASGDRA